jgi:transcription termination/antitermination protein NusA
MHPEVEHVIEAVGMEKGISKELIWEAVEDSMLSAVHRQVGMQFNVEVKFNPKVKELEVFKVLRVVPIVNDAFTEITVEHARALFDIDDELLEKLDPYLGRVAAQAAKQNLMQHLRDTVEAD